MLSAAKPAPFAENAQAFLPQPEASQGESVDAGILPPELAAPGGGVLAPVQHQVRIERRVVIRVTSRSRNRQHQALAELPAEELDDRYKEKRVGKCLPIKSVVAVKVAQNNRLLLFTRDDRIISAKLEKSCRARDFYSGFYVEKSDDGMICAERDVLHSRAGVNCEMTKLRRLVPVNGPGSP